MVIKDPKIIKLKGILFLFLGLFSSGLLLCFHFDITTAALLLIAVWSFCRFYYFGFYVLHHYADPEFKYSGLVDLAKYLIRGRQR